MARKAFRTEVGGAAAIEFAIVGSFLCLLVVAIGDVGLGFYSDIQVQNSAQAGAQYAIVHGYSSSAISTAVTSATSVPGISAIPAPLQFCGCVDPTSKTVASATCGTTCASDGMNAGTYVTASAQRDYSTLITYPNFASSYHQTASSTVRIK
jgi:Flp pilus assembly protein TadG